jgi:hypothetical protein
MTDQSRPVVTMATYCLCRNDSRHGWGSLSSTRGGQSGCQVRILCEIARGVRGGRQRARGPSYKKPKKSRNRSKFLAAERRASRGEEEAGRSPPGLTRPVMSARATQSAYLGWSGSVFTLAGSTSWTGGVCVSIRAAQGRGAISDRMRTCAAVGRVLDVRRQVAKTLRPWSDLRESKNAASVGVQESAPGTERPPAFGEDVAIELADEARAAGG